MIINYKSDIESSKQTEKDLEESLDIKITDKEFVNFVDQLEFKIAELYWDWFIFRNIFNTPQSLDYLNKLEKPVIFRLRVSNINSIILGICGLLERPNKDYYNLTFQRLIKNQNLESEWPCFKNLIGKSSKFNEIRQKIKSLTKAINEDGLKEYRNKRIAHTELPKLSKKLKNTFRYYIIEFKDIYNLLIGSHVFFELWRWETESQNYLCQDTGHRFLANLQDSENFHLIYKKIIDTESGRNYLLERDFDNDQAIKDFKEILLLVFHQKELTNKIRNQLLSEFRLNLQRP